MYILNPYEEGYLLRYKYEKVTYVYMYNIVENMGKNKDVTVPTCSCSYKCTCNALVNVSKYKVQDHIIKFLRGLKDNYLTVRTQILLMDHFPSFNRVCSLITQ